MSAAPPLRVVPPSVEFDGSHQVMLLCSPPDRSRVAALAEPLLALGCDVRVVSGSLEELVEGLQVELDAELALLVPFGEALDNPVLRARVGRAIRHAHLWLEGGACASVPELERAICEHLDAFRRARTEAPSPTECLAEPSNVVHLPLAPPPPASESVPAPDAHPQLSWLHFAAWPVLGAALTAAAMALLRVDSEPEPEPEPLAVATAERAATPEPTSVPAPEPTPVPAAEPEPEPEPIPAGEPGPAPAPAAEPDPAMPDDLDVVAPQPSPLEAAMAHERVTATDDLLVFTAAERPRDWYAAMNVCRGRTHAELEGWRTPSSRELHALAKARVLPEQELWSRTRSLHAQDVAFIVHGRAGTARGTPKEQTVPVAVCVRKRDPQLRGT